MFEPRGAFAPPPAALASGFIASRAHSAFRPWPSDPDIADDAAGREPTTIIDPTEQMRAEAFADGLRQGEALAQETAALAMASAAARIAATADRIGPICENLLAALLAETVATLMDEMFMTNVAGSEQLERRAMQLAQMIRDDVEPVGIRLHPDDAAMMAGAALPWPMTADTLLERGEIRLDTREGGVNDNPADRIERLRRRIAGEASL